MQYSLCHSPSAPGLWPVMVRGLVSSLLLNCTAANLTHEFRIIFLKTKDWKKIHNNLHFFALKNLEQEAEYINIHNFT